MLWSLRSHLGTVFKTDVKYILLVQLTQINSFLFLYITSYSRQTWYIQRLTNQYIFVSKHKHERGPGNWKCLLLNMLDKSTLSWHRIYCLEYRTIPGLGGFPCEQVNSYLLQTEHSRPCLYPLYPWNTHLNHYLMTLQAPRGELPSPPN